MSNFPHQEKRKRDDVHREPPFAVKLAKWLIVAPARAVTKAAWAVIREVLATYIFILEQIMLLPWRLLRFLFVGRVPKQFDSVAQEESFWAVKRRYRRRRLFMLHKYLYIIGVLFLVWHHLTYSSGIPEGMMFVIAWTLMLGFHYERVNTGESEDSELLAVFKQETSTKSSNFKHFGQRPPTYAAPISDYTDYARSRRMNPTNPFARASSASPVRVIGKTGKERNPFASYGDEDAEDEDYRASLRKIGFNR